MLRTSYFSVRYKTMTFWNLVLLIVPNDRRIFFEIWAIVFNREISPADRPNHFKENTSFV